MIEVMVTIIERKMVFIPEMPKDNIAKYLHEKWGSALVSHSFIGLIRCYGCGNRQIQEIQEEFLCSECKSNGKESI